MPRCRMYPLKQTRSQTSTYLRPPPNDKDVPCAPTRYNVTCATRHPPTSFDLFKPFVSNRTSMTPLGLRITSNHWHRFFKEPFVKHPGVGCFCRFPCFISTGFIPLFQTGLFVNSDFDICSVGVPRHFVPSGFNSAQWADPKILSTPRPSIS